jgi:4-amino-4-deoxy-L-arabinose transferase-like glycosyltransferase
MYNWKALSKKSGARQAYTDLLAVSCLIILATILRFSRIGSLPIFNDETIYGRWIQIMRSYHDWSVPFSDGKQPLFFWAAAAVQYLGLSPLIALRIVSAAAGVAGVVLTYLAGTRIFGRHAGFAAAVLYAVTPFLLFHDRLGVPDAILAALAPAILLCGFELGRRPGARYAVVLFLLFTVAFLIKTTGVLLFPAAVAGVLIVGYSPKSLLQAGGAMVAAFLSTLLLIKAVPGGGFVFGKSAGFMLSSRELLELPLSIWTANAGLIAEWLVSYLSWPLLFMIAVALLVCARERRAAPVLIILAGLAPLIFVALAGRIIFSRYVVFTVPLLLLGAAGGITALTEKRRALVIPFGVVLFLLVIGLVGLKDLPLIRNPVSFSWTADDRFQYIEGWPAGYGFTELTNYLQGKAKKSNIIVVAQNGMGLPRDGLDLAGDTGVGSMIIVPDALEGRVPEPPAGKARFTYFVINHPRTNAIAFEKANPRLHLKAIFEKPNKLSSFRVYAY